MAAVSDENMSRGLYSAGFTRVFRGFFRPLSALLNTLKVTPNMVTCISGILGIVMGVLLAYDHLWLGVLMGFAVGFADIVDGQMAKEFGGATRFGGILDSTIDRYVEFFLFAGLGARYILLGRPFWALLAGTVFLGSVMVSYVKARAEADGFECKVGRLQRPERLTIAGFGLLFLGPGVDIMIVILAVGTQLTVIQRLVHVRRQTRE